MSTEKDLKTAEDESVALTEHVGTRSIEVHKGEGGDNGDERVHDGIVEDREASPIQFGYQRFVYAAYMGLAMVVAFLVAKSVHAGWYRLGQWKPAFGDPKDEIVYPVAGVLGILVSLYYWRKPSSRQYANEVAEELSKVTWPSKKEVWNSTTVVIVTTLFATVFFALMDQFWKYVTDKIYSF